MDHEVTGWAAVAIFLIQSLIAWFQQRNSKKIDKAQVGIEETKAVLIEHHGVVQTKMQENTDALILDTQWKQRVDHELQEVREWVKSLKREIQVSNGSSNEVEGEDK